MDTFDNKSWDKLQQQWEAHDLRVEDIARQHRPAESKRHPSPAWRYAAAAALILTVGIGLWQLLDTPKTAPLVAAADNEQPAAVQTLPLQREQSIPSEPAALEKRAIAAQPATTQPEAASVAETITASDVPPETAAPPVPIANPEPRPLMGLPLGNEFATVRIDGRDGVVYIRCNNFCDAQSIANETGLVI